jgi:3-hydroxymyristoyl/3-hydroxydecanoyl-(acyl carrier protein) dehydratase/1-acyl-sn-glycerol-3-phosphate acyltransferase/malonyl CoA-acyl carrier protein transacylase
MGRELLLALPELADTAPVRLPNRRALAQRIYGARGAESTPESPDLLEQLAEYSFLCQIHSALSQRILQLRPHAAIGLCTGESSALFALGAWKDLAEMLEEIRIAGVYDRELAGEFAAVRRAFRRDGLIEEVDWASWRVLCPVEEVCAAAAREARAYVTLIHSPTDCILSGQRAACERALLRLGEDGRRRARELTQVMAIHCPEVQEFASGWRAIHSRRTDAVAGVRFYSHAKRGSYLPDRESAADALLGQAVVTVDFPRLITRAWQDGVRVFVEHGPRGLCSGWIRQSLGGREHLAVSLDASGQPALTHLVHTVAQLVVAGVPVRTQALLARLQPPTGPAPKRELRIAAHRPQVQARVRSSEPARALVEPVPTAPAAQRMEPAPEQQPAWELPTRRDPAPRSTATPPIQRAALDVIAQHRKFLALQQSLQEQFLEGRRRALHGLLSVRSAPLQSAPPQAVASQPVPPTPLGGPAGLTLSRAQLEVLASGKISSVLGPRFVGQDGYLRQVRMPMPPLLLADRVTGLTGEPGSMGTGTIWTETDVSWDAFYLHDGYMVPGAMVEAGQADLLLISWLGVDAHNRGERVYRLLGCELSFHGGLPRSGDTLSYEIRVEGHAVQAGVRLFFFHYDCSINGVRRMTMRHGQAGFFTDAELAESAGVLWDPARATPCEDPRLAPPVVACQRTSFSAEQVAAFAAGDAHACLGPGFELARTHVRTPRIAGEPLRFWQRVPALDLRGGPWGRGYLRAVQDVGPDDWYFPGHFKNDPCMPGTLMCEACLQAMGLYLAALGHTLSRDGWRFEPVSDEVFDLRCRGQVTPSSKEVVYEVFVEEILDGPQPTLYADVLVTVDGLKAFHGRRLGLRLIPDWPLTSLRALPAAPQSERPALFDYAALLACAWGRPSAAFGEAFRRYDALQRIPRLPGPPYHFMTRVTHLEAECGVLKPGGVVEVEYDVPADAWYFAGGARQAMPMAVLLEVALQPCGWLAMYVGCRLFDETQLFFRNLDGSATLAEPVYAEAGRLTVRAKLVQLSRSAGIILVGFDVECRSAGRVVYTVKTVFGFFPPDALAAQVGLPVDAEQRARLHAPSSYAQDLRELPAAHLAGPLARSSPPLCMLDRVTGYWPDGGAAGLGRLRAEKDINAGQWFFKAHFYQDPVQPGSLGLQAMLQLLQLALLSHGGIADPEELEWEPIALGVQHTWRYRGQVLPSSRKVTVEIELCEWRPADPAPYARAAAWLWVDELCIYHARDLALRAHRHRTARSAAPSAPAASSRGEIERARAFWLSRLGVPMWPGAELLAALAQRFVGTIHHEAPEELPRLRQRGALILANHQVQVESLLFPLLLAAELQRPVVTLASARHEQGWLGELVRLIFSYPGVPDPDIIRYFDRQDPASLLRIVEGFLPDLRDGRRSVMVHVEGQLGRRCRQPVEVLSGLFVDLALNAEVPILPVRFAGGLPVEPLDETLDFPFKYGRQDYHVGRPIYPDELRALPYAERKRRVLHALNQLGPPLESEVPHAADEELLRAVSAWRERAECGEAQAVILQALLRATELVTDEARRLREGARSGCLKLPAGPVGAWLARVALWLYGPKGPVAIEPQ